MSEPDAGGRWRKRLLRAARLLLAGALLVWVFSRVEPGEAWAELLAAPPWIWPAVLGLFLLNSWLYAARVVVLMPTPAPVMTVFQAVLVGNFAGIALPTGGAEAAKVVTIAPHAGGADRALAFIAATRLIELVIWGGLVAWAAAAVLPGRLDVLVPFAWLSALGFVVGALVLAVAFRHGGVLAQRLAWLPKRLAAFAVGASAPFAEMARAPGKLAASAGITALFAATNCFTAWLIFRVYGVNIPYAEVLGLIPTLDIFLSLPLAPASVGVREVVFLNALAPYGADAGVALAVGYTRMSGHFSRAAIGGLLFALGRRPGGTDA